MAPQTGPGASGGEEEEEEEGGALVAASVKAPNDGVEPPEGGWGWMVAVGMAVMFVSTTGQYGSFALLFDGFLTDLGQETTGATLIMNAFTAAFNFTGLVTNHMLTRMSYRKVALLGGTLFTTGILLTTFARTMAHALVTYSVLAGVGFGLIAPSSFLAFNSYFLRRRGFAMGVCQAGIGLGFMASPPIIQYLIEEYSFSGTMLILSAVALHSLLGAALYQPIKWHLRKVQAPGNGHVHLTPPASGEGRGAKEEGRSKSEGGVTGTSPSNGGGSAGNAEEQRSGTHDENDEEVSQPLAAGCRAEDHKQRAEWQDQIRANGKPQPLPPAASLPSLSKEWEGDEGSTKLSTCYQRQSASLINLGTIVLVFSSGLEHHGECNAATDMQRRALVAQPSGEVGKEFGGVQRKKRKTAQTMGGKLCSAWERLVRGGGRRHSPKDEPPLSQTKVVGGARTVFGFVVDFLDLRLLKDPSYVNLALGLSVSCLSDTNFFTVLPFHLQKTLGFSQTDVAVCLSAAAGADVASRLLLPFLGDHLRLQKRTAYLLGCLTSAIARSIFVLVEDFASVVAFCALVGFLKGTMVVNLALTIAEHCRLEKFAAAFGLYMIMSGIITISLGPLIGVVRDWSESYELCIHVLSGVLLLCAIPWLIEMAIVRWKCDRRRKKKGRPVL